MTIAPVVRGIAGLLTWTTHSSASTTISEVGAKGWIILTKDSALRRNPLEVRAILSARTGVFIFGNASVTSKQLANGLVLALPRVRTALRRFAVPVIGRVNIAGGVDVLWEDGTKLERPKRVK